MRDLTCSVVMSVAVPGVGEPGDLAHAIGIPRAASLNGLFQPIRMWGFNTEDSNLVRFDFGLGAKCHFKTDTGTRFLTPSQADRMAGVWMALSSSRSL